MSIPPDLPSTTPCKIAFVGEAPGDDEMLRGTPLVGPSGRIFNSLLRVAGIDRNAVLVTNVFDTQLPDNDVENWCISTKEKNNVEGYDLPAVKRGKWLNPKYIHHLDRLEREIEQAAPNIIVPLGGTALWAFTGYFGIMARRGAVAEATMVGADRKIIPTLHPAFLIHSWKMYQPTAADFIKAREESASPEIRTTPRELWLDVSIADIKRFIDEHMETAPYISIDIETIPSWKQITHVGFSSGPHHGISIPFAIRDTTNRNYWATADEELEAWKLVAYICQLPQPKLGQNFPYDAQWLFDLMGIPVLNYREDTRLIHHAQQPELKKDLGFLGSCYAQELAWKTLRAYKTEKRDE